MKTKVIYISGGAKFSEAEINAVFTEIRQQMGWDDVVLFGVPMDDPVEFNSDRGTLDVGQEILNQVQTDDVIEGAISGKWAQNNPIEDDVLMNEPLVDAVCAATIVDDEIVDVSCEAIKADEVIEVVADKVDEIAAPVELSRNDNNIEAEEASVNIAPILSVLGAVKNISEVVVENNADIARATELVRNDNIDEISEELDDEKSLVAAIFNVDENVESVTQAELIRNDNNLENVEVSVTLVPILDNEGGEVSVTSEMVSEDEDEVISIASTPVDSDENSEVADVLIVKPIDLDHDPFCFGDASTLSFDQNGADLNCPTAPEIEDEEDEEIFSVKSSFTIEDILPTVPGLTEEKPQDATLQELAQQFSEHKSDEPIDSVDKPSGFSKLRQMLFLKKNDSETETKTKTKAKKKEPMFGLLDLIDQADDDVDSFDLPKFLRPGAV